MSEQKDVPLCSRQETATVWLLFAGKTEENGVFILEPGAQPDLVTVEEEKGAVGVQATEKRAALPVGK